MNKENIMDDNKVIQAKLILIGESSVGKTSLIRQFVDKTFTQNILSTIGADIILKQEKIENSDKAILFKIWDSAGQEKYRSIAKNLFVNAEGIMLVYDVTQANTLEKVEEWMESIKEECNEGIPIILIGNKIDLERVVTEDEGKKMAEKYRLEFMETSASSGVGVKEAFMKIGNMIVEYKNENIDTDKEGGEQIIIGETNKKLNKKKRCCP